LGYLETIFNYYTNVVGDVSIVCTAANNTGSVTAVGPADGNPTVSAISCPGGTVETGINGTTGDIFESVTLQCQ